eukprot:CAMPEP_0201707778 /NCGR_PEP_ID=MMETSP0578-20130828/53131_1 /ASSEMBLY_ACC=CAM_ASM_000663 /TAXON_ID=267565 /ORGANISM="Skeletonema grethea, Strain CCMP 1804" /LENGTH=30 /DNA_ID= /DNA_START= /DNA_END= /DNA_ORIENTATION=
MPVPVKFNARTTRFHHLAIYATPFLAQLAK